MNDRTCLIAVGILSAAGLAACAEPPTFGFRGYTNQSSCRAVIDAELEIGSVFEGAFDSEDPLAPGMITEMTGELFSEPVLIEIACSRRGAIDSVHYIAKAEHRTETDDIFEDFTYELKAIFGTPEERLTREVRSRRFLCGDPATVLLEEWTLTEDERELYLAVIPRSTRC